MKYGITKEEVIIGKLKNTNRAFEKAREIKELIENQLIENSKGQGKLQAFRQLNRLVNENNLQFEFTMEGTDIITYSGEESIAVRRTYYEKENAYKNSCIKCLFSPEEMEKFAKERKNNNIQLLNKFDMNEKWKRRRELILKRQETDEDKKLFIEGEKISKIIEEANDEYVLKNYKDVVADYIIEKYQTYGNLTDGEEKDSATREFQEYVNLKEKGIAIDAKILLEEVQNKIEKKFVEQRKEKNMTKEEIEKQIETENTFNSYARFFDLIKGGRELNARIVAKLTKIDFTKMKRIFSKFHKDDEILKYIDLKEKEKIINLLDEIEIEFKMENSKDIVYLNGKDVTSRIREKDVAKIVSQISSIKEVRFKLNEIFRQCAKDKNVIMEGRDIGTYVFPNAEVKFYLDASEEIRAKRRVRQNKEQGIEMTYEEVLENIKIRDKNDKEKEIGALKQAEDAIYINSDSMTPQQEADEVIKIIKNKMKGL